MPHFSNEKVKPGHILYLYISDTLYTRRRTDLWRSHWLGLFLSLILKRPFHIHCKRRILFAFKSAVIEWSTIPRSSSNQLQPEQT